MNVLKSTFIVYIVLLHICFVYTISKTHVANKIIRDFYPDETTSYRYKSLVTMQLRIDENALNNATLVFGDSHVQGLAVSSIGENILNYGIGEDTITGLTNRIVHYNSIRIAKNIIILIGVNDILLGFESDAAERFSRILDLISPTINIFILEIPYVTLPKTERIQLNKKIQDLNNQYELIAKTRKNVTFITINDMLSTNYELNSEAHIGDGLHLNPKANDLLLRRIQRVISE